MKKTFLSLVAMGFGVSVAFAQTAPAEIESTGTQTTEEVQEQPMENVAEAEAEKDRKKVEMSALPVATQVAFQNGDYSEHEVLAVYEVAAEEGSEAKIYEFELAKEAQGSGTSEIEGVEIEKVSERQPDVILQIDENGQLVEEKNMDEEEK